MSTSEHATSTPHAFRWRRTLAATLCVAALSSACAGAGSAELTELDSAPTTTVLASDPIASSTTTEAPVLPTYGGRLTYGVEADTLNAWTPQNAAAAISGHLALRSVFDSLALPDADGVVKGVLLESIEPNADFTQWTLTTRSGITFHDGTPFDADAVVENLQRHRQSFLTGTILRDVTSVEALDDTTVVVSIAHPWPSFPVTLTTQVGYIASPTWLRAIDDEPALATSPVGTGPFVFAEYVEGDFFRVERNDDYWQEGLPYLDEVQFVIMRSTRERTASIRDGATNIIHTDRGDEIVRFREQLDQFGLVESTEFGESRFLMLNQLDPDSEVRDVRVRTALALALDTDLYRAARAANLFEVANGPFTPGSVGYLEDNGFPTPDLDEAIELVEEYEAENGPIEIDYAVTDDEFNLITAELIAGMWRDAGIDVTIRAIPQSDAISQALLGNFEAILWRNFAAFDPDLLGHWWHSETSVDGLALNFARIEDDVIDGHLDTIRESADPDERRAAAEAINRRFAEQVYSIWLTWPAWAIAHTPDVRQVITGYTLPDGSEVLPTGVGIGGTHQLAQIWLEQP